MDPKIRKTSYDILVQGSQWRWPPRGKRSRPVPKRLRRRKKPSVIFRIQEERNRATSYRTYLFPLAVSLFKVGCRVEYYLRCWRLREIQALNSVREPPVTLQALSSAIDCARAVQFDSDSYPIGVDCRASRCMANSPHLFEDLKLTKMGEVEGIKQGLDIRGIGTFKFKIDNDNGKMHKIKVPNTLNVPDLRRCLLLPQHWAQEARDNHLLPRGTQMENDNKNHVLLWGQAKYKKTIPFSSQSNVPIMYLALSSLTYRAFAMTFKAMKANFFRREHVLQVPGLRRLEQGAPDEQEFIAKENVNFDGSKSKDSVSHDDASEGDHAREPETTTRMQALTFDPSPPLEEEEEYQLAAADNQAELMRWHYCLGHLSFAKLELLAKNGEIPHRLAKVPAPKCAGCLFGAMTKLPWRGKESKSSHKVFVATKPGECVSVDPMVSTQTGFFAQLKGKLTSKRYRAASIFVDHFSRLRFVHLMQDLSSEETINAKLAFEQFAAKHGMAIKHYHCDNGRFMDIAFKQACKQGNQ
jgi:hypothetical protein